MSARTFTDGSGADSTAASIAKLTSTLTPIMFTFVKIQMTRWLDTIAQEFGITTIFPSPFTKQFLLTDCPAAVNYAPIGTFTNANIKQTGMPFEIGVDFKDFTVEWVPTANDVVVPSGGGGAFVPTPIVSAADAVLFGFFDGAIISVYNVLMPTYYDASTYGVTLLNSGVVTSAQRDGAKIVFSVGSMVDQQNHQVPSQLIGPNSRFAAIDPLAYDGVSYKGPFGGPTDQVHWGPWFARPTTGPTPPQTASKIILTTSIITAPANGYFDGGFLVWTSGPLMGMRRPIARFLSVDPDANNACTWQLAEPYPFECTQFSSGYLNGWAFSAYAPRNQQSGETSGTYDGFPVMPLPSSAY